MPRLKKYGEVTTNHQLATAKELQRFHYNEVTYSEDELQQKLLRMNSEKIKPLYKINIQVSKQLLNSIETFINI